jgi:hypothetical protein
MLVAVNGRPPIGVAKRLYAGGGGVGVYFDFLPAEGDMAVFNQVWFFAKPAWGPYYREKVKIITESVPIEYW